MYGRSTHIYGLQSRCDKMNVVVGEKRKDFNAGGKSREFQEEHEWE